MSGALFLLGAFAAIILTLVVVRQWEARTWRRSLIGWRVRLPADLSIDDVTRWLAAIASLTHTPRGVLLPSPPVVVEVLADAKGIEHRLLAPKGMADAVLATLRGSLPAVRLEPLTDNRVHLPRSGYRTAAGLRLAGRHRQLAVERGEASSRGLVAALQPLHGQERICWQWIVTGAGTPSPVQQPQGAQAATALPWWLEEQAPADADGLRAARLKQRQPLLTATARLVVTSGRRQRSNALFGQAWGGIRLMNVPGSRLLRDYWPAFLVERQVRSRFLPSLGWPLLLNAAELAGLMPWPVGSDSLPGVPAGITRQVPPPPNLATTGTVIADSTYPGLERPITIAPRDRLMHVALLGPTGTGKSTTMVNMALQDAARGDGLAILDPKADMAGDLLTHLPESRHPDVILVNPADTDRPVGFNVLATDGSEAAREMAVDHVLHVFHEQWREFWGPRTEAVLRSALLVLVSTQAADGSAFTVCELPALLTDAGFRQWATSRPGVPDSVLAFWNWFNGLSKSEQTQVVGPVINKLSALTQRTPLRLLLGQSQGLDLTSAIQDRKILVMPLSRGLIGAETAALLSSLMVASLWQAVLRRVRVPAAERRPWWLFVDEASEVVRLPIDLADMMAESRGLGSGLVLATQYLAQLPTPVRKALLSTVRSQIVFQVEAEDARLLSRSFSPTLDEMDLRNLPSYEVALRVSIDGQTSRPMTGRTRPLPEPNGDSSRLRQASRQQYGQARVDVEAALRRRSQTDHSSQQFGQRATGRRTP
jgi:Type IV secretion-system coupling protein DNA-binding domain